MKKSTITFWGVRGSLASAGLKTAKYGGNTPCVEISYGKTVIICDAGTGIRPLGRAMIKSSRGRKIGATILLSHLHLDHVIGLPFFEPLYKKANRFTIINPKRSAAKLKSDLKKLFGPPYFPVSISDVAPALKFGEFKGPVKTGEITIESFKCNHPDDSYAFKFLTPGKKTVVYVCDNEPSESQDAFIRFMRGADVLIHDAQYTPAQYKDKTGWGHSPYTYALNLAAKAGVKKLVLFHYDPAATDRDLDRISKKIRKSGVLLSREGMRLTV